MYVRTLEVDLIRKKYIRFYDLTLVLYIFVVGEVIINAIYAVI